jgi:hypothetical protein
MKKSTRKIENPKSRSAVAGECRKRADSFKDKRTKRKRTRDAQRRKFFEDQDLR